MIKIKTLTTATLMVLSSAALLISCTTISYVPKVSLDVSPVTINKSVQVEKFNDITPSRDKTAPFFGLCATTKESVPGSLDLEVTEAIVNDFSINGVFKQVSRRVENPDFILRGDIRRFTGKSRLNTFGKVSWGLGIAP